MNFRTTSASVNNETTPDSKRQWVTNLVTPARKFIDLAPVNPAQLSAIYTQHLSKPPTPI
jgi:hypothetical protein